MIVAIHIQSFERPEISGVSPDGEIANGIDWLERLDISARDFLQGIYFAMSGGNSTVRRLQATHPNQKPLRICGDTHAAVS
jgi:hypothetical protein